MQKFLKPKMIEIGVEDLNGKEHHFECPQITQEMLNRVIEIGNRPVKTGRGLYEQFSVYFGMKPEQYKDFDARVIKSVIVWMNEQMGNPQLRED